MNTKKKLKYKNKQKSISISKNSKDNFITNDKYPKIEGKLKSIFGISDKLIEHLRNNLHILYSKSNNKEIVTSSKVHQILLNLFINEYYSIVSKNIKEDKNTMSVVMGGVAFNMNIPEKLKFLKVLTDDVDLKVYTTDINYMNKSPAKVAKVLSVFKYIIIIICMFLKQIIPEVIEFSKNVFKDAENSKHTKKHKETYKQYVQKNAQNTKHKNLNLIANAHKKFGFMKSGKAIIIIKRNKEEEIDMKDKSSRSPLDSKNAVDNNPNNNPNNNINEHETFDLFTLSYVETFNLIMKNIDDPDILVTNKVVYGIDYNKAKRISRNRITFSDSKIIYPNIDYSSFYAYYFMNNRNNITYTYPIEKLIKTNLCVSDILNYKNCNNNDNDINNKCHFTSFKTLLLDSCLMLSYAELLIHENIINGVILVKISSIYKYYKYIIKFIKLHIIKKFYNKTLNKEFVETSKNLQLYILNNLRKKTELVPEGHQLNIIYKKILNDFHQSFFKNKSLLDKFKALHEIVDNYEYNLIFINKSKSLFIDLNNNYNNIREHDKLEESASIKLANDISKNDVSKVMNGGKSQNNFILHNKYLFEDIDLDNNNNINNIIEISKDKSQSYKSKNDKIKDKLYKLIKDEIHELNIISKNI